MRKNEKKKKKKKKKKNFSYKQGFLVSNNNLPLNSNNNPCLYLNSDHDVSPNQTEDRLVNMTSLVPFMKIHCFGNTHLTPSQLRPPPPPP